jgi:hypothetical protein
MHEHRWDLMNISIGIGLVLGLFFVLLSFGSGPVTAQDSSQNPTSGYDKGAYDEAIWSTKAGNGTTNNDTSLVLSLNLNNNTRIGETSTKAVDVSRYKNDGTISGAAWTSAGRFNSALQFDGIDDYVDCGNSSTLDIIDKITVELWMKPEEKQEVCWDGYKGNYGVMAKAETGILGNIWSWQLRYGSPDNCSLGFQFNGYEGDKWVTVKQNLTPGKWYHVAGTFDGTYIKCYLDGVLKDTNEMHGIQQSNARLFIGEEGWHNMFKGTIDEIRIYRRALTAQEITMHYKQTQ